MFRQGKRNALYPSVIWQVGTHCSVWVCTLVCAVAKMSRDLTSEQTECCIAAAKQSQIEFRSRGTSLLLHHLSSAGFQLPWQLKAVLTPAHPVEEGGGVGSGLLPVKGAGTLDRCSGQGYSDRLGRELLYFCGILTEASPRHFSKTSGNCVSLCIRAKIHLLRYEN